MSKKKAQKIHAQRRFAERHFLPVSERDLDEMTKIIQNRANTPPGTQAPRCVEKQSNRVTVWDIEYEGKIRRVVYDKKRHQIVTTLFREEDEEM